MLIFLWGQLNANPTGGTVVGGSANISSAGSTLTINQTTDRAVINWNSFSIASGETTSFIQPSSTSAVLNRVTGANLSEIYGTLSSNGQVYLINPNGILIGSGGVINTQGGFVASTHDVANSEFLSGGDLTFSGNSSAAIINAGKIGVDNGDVYLIARQVTNSGEISAPKGEVGIAGGTQILLKASGTDKISILPSSASGTIENTSTGVIKAATASLKAVGGNEYALAINNGGVIRADGVEKIDGKVILFATNGKTKNTGTIIAKNKDGNGGFIETSGNEVELKGSILTGEGGEWLIDPFTVDSSTNFSISTVVAALAQSHVTILASSSITLDESITWSSTYTLTLTSGGTITIGGNITGTDGGLTLNAAAGSLASPTITSTGNINVKNFTLTQGTWSQVAASLPSFYAYNFVLNGGTFLRATGGDGSSGTPYLITDVYGVQGMASTSLLSKSFTLANNIDASGTSSWNGGAGFKPIGNSSNRYTGIFSGAGYTIDGLYISRSSTNYIGLIGYVGSGGTVSHVGLTNVNITGLSAVGGLVGYNVGAVSSSYATGSVTGNTYVGGLVGYNVSTVSTSYATDSVTGNSFVGGLVGYNVSTVSTSYATGNVTGNTSVGGLVGSNSGRVEYSYATGSVIGTSSYGYAGGLVGSNSNGATIEYTYAAGAVTGTNYLGGLVGYNDAATISNSYWDSTTTGLSSGYGVNNIGTITNLTAVTSSTAYSSYSNFGTWDLASNNGYSNAASNVYTTTDGKWVMIDGATRPFLLSEYSTAIKNTHQLQLMALDQAANYTLGKNISFSSSDWGGSGMWTAYGFSSIGDSVTRYTGTFNGNGYVINGLYINRSSTNYIGLFGYNTGIIQNVGLVGGSVDGANYVGDLVGYNAGTVQDSYATGSVTSYTGSFGYVGGLVGQNNGTVQYSYATGSVTGAYNNVGGLVGYNDNNGTVQYSYATGSVGGANNVGGLVGYNNGILQYSYATGSASGSYYIGGLVGYNNSSGSARYSYATGSVTGSGNFRSFVGGLVGYNAGTLQYSYATGLVNSTSTNVSVGGLVGQNGSNGTVRDCYWDTSATGWSDAIGYDSVVNGGIGTVSGTLAGNSNISNIISFISSTALTSANFSHLGDFTIGTGVWGISSAFNGGLPYFQWKNPYLIITASDQSVSYGSTANTTATLGTTYTLSGLKSADNASNPSGITISLNGSNVNAGQTNTLVATSSNATYTGTSGTTYVITTVSGTETITPVALSITIGNASSTYGSTPNVSGVNYTITSGALQNGESQSVLNLVASTDRTSSTPAGTYTGTITATWNNSNYNITFTPGTLTVQGASIPTLPASFGYYVQQTMLPLSGTSLLNLPGVGGGSLPPSVGIANYLLRADQQSLSGNSFVSLDGMLGAYNGVYGMFGYNPAMITATQQITVVGNGSLMLTGGANTSSITSLLTQSSAMIIGN